MPERSASLGEHRVYICRFRPLFCISLVIQPFVNIVRHSTTSFLARLCVHLDRTLKRPVSVASLYFSFIRSVT